MTAVKMNSTEMLHLVQKIVAENPGITLERFDADTQQITFSTLRVSNSIGLVPLEVEYIMKNQIINAIKAVRERTGCGLKEAKDLCEQYRNFKNVPF